MTLFGKFIGNTTTRVLRPSSPLWRLAGSRSQASAEDGEADLERGEAALLALRASATRRTAAATQRVLAPAIAGMPSWYVEKQLQNFKSGIRGLHAEDTGGLRMYPMSQWLRTEADQEAVAAYVASMPAISPSVNSKSMAMRRRARATTPSVGACHGADRRRQPRHGRSAAHRQSDWYLYSSIEKYKSCDSRNAARGPLRRRDDRDGGDAAR